MSKATLTDETWSALAALLLVWTVESSLQRTLAHRFAKDLEESTSMTERMQTLYVALSALLTVRGSGSGEASTTSPLDSGSSRSL